MGLDDQIEVEPRASRSDEFYPRATAFQQFRALFLKDLTLQWRSWRTNLCQCLTPIIFILFAGIMQVVVNMILSEHEAVIHGTEVPLPPINPGRMLSCQHDLNDSAPYHPDNCRKEVLNFFVEFPYWLDYLDQIGNMTNSSIVANITEQMTYLEEMSYEEPCQKTLYDLPFYYVGASSELGTDFLGNFTSDVRTGLVGNMIPDAWHFNFSLNFMTQYNSTGDDTCPVPDEDSISLPLFRGISNHSALNHLLVDVVKEYNNLAGLSSSSRDQYARTYGVSPLSENEYNAVISFIKNGTLEKVKPQGGIFFDLFKYHQDSSTVDIHYIVTADELALYRFYFVLSSSVLNKENVTKLDIDVHRRNAIINMVDNAIIKKLLNISGGEDPIITTYIMGIPVFNTMFIKIDIASILGGILYPFATSFLIPVFMASIVKDKHEKHLIMMEQNGLNRWTYWLVTYTFNFMLYVPIAIEIFIFSLIFRLRLFTQTNGLVLILTFFLWGHAEVILGFFLSNFFGRPRTATIVGYILVIAGVVIALLLAALQIFPSDQTPFPIYMMYPPFSFYRLLFYYTNACLTMRCYGVDILSPLNGLNLVTEAMVYLVGASVLLMLASVYLSYVLPGEYGVRRSPFFPITGLYKWIMSLIKERTKQKNLELDRSPPRSRAAAEIGMENEEEDIDIDIDVQAEEDGIRDHFPDGAPMVMHKLRKEYPGSGGRPPYVAVHSISLAIDRNECFGLLGPNGAGKTTLISVLTGLYEPTSGTARIAGFDIATEISAIHHHLGVCPQFDIQHNELTAEEHLLFYARLKGVKWSKEKMVVERALRQVNLYDARKRKSKNLSGGMRRRLSVAMACIGNPDILILDEPTTGLDPASRRQVWEVIEAVKDGRSVILTTHAMEEADHLCTRIGIMNFGKLRCLGTQTRLKARFGTGYQLTFNCAPGQVWVVENYVQMNLPMAVHVETYADSCTFKLEKEHLKVSELFPMINREKVRLGILDWGVKMSTLEDVFLKIVKRHSDHRTHGDHSLLSGWLPCKHCHQRRKDEDDDE